MDFMKIQYTGKTEDNKIFATTDQKKAIDSGIYNDKTVYKPSVIIFEEKSDKITEKIKEEIKDMKPGDEKTIKIPKELGYQYDPKLVQVLPLSVFKKQKINPFPGMLFEYNGRIGKIESSSGGRARVDFNSELAGKNLIYEIKIEEIVKSDEEKIKYLIERSFNNSKDFKIRIEEEKEKKAIINIPKNAFLDELIVRRKSLLVSEINKYLNIKKIVFEEEW